MDEKLFLEKLMSHSDMLGTYNANLINPYRQLVISWMDEAKGKFTGTFGPPGEGVAIAGYFHFNHEGRRTDLSFEIGVFKYQFTQPYHSDGPDFRHFQGVEFNNGVETGSWQFRNDTGRTTNSGAGIGSGGISH